MGGLRGESDLLIGAPLIEPSSGAGLPGVELAPATPEASDAEPVGERDLVRTAPDGEKPLVWGTEDARDAAPDDLSISGYRFAIADGERVAMAPSDLEEATAYLSVTTYKRGGSLFLDVTDSFDSEVDGEALGYRIFSRGVEQPDWIREVRDGFYVLDIADRTSRGADGMIDLTVIADMDDGRALEKAVRIDPVTGELVPLGEDGAPATFLGRVKAAGLRT